MGAAAVAVAAAILLFWRLDAVYLWQDEANTGVLAQRLLRLGKPLGYDGVNLVTADHFAAEDRATIDTRTGNAKAAVDYVIHRGDLRADGAWTYQPWGQFVVAAAGIEALGATTLGARLPFAIAAFATVLLLGRLARRAGAQPAMAWLAAALLVDNGAWVLHARQARYYALSSLLLVLAFLAFERWQRGARFGAVLFVAAAWCFFQVDYGTVLPALGVLLAAACVSRARPLREILLVALALAASLAPFVFFYELAGRHALQLDTWWQRFGGNLFNLNRYAIPVVVMAAAAACLWARWERIAAGERRLVAVALATLAALMLWVPSVAPAAFPRYVVMAAPLGALVCAWLVAQAWMRSRALACALAAVVAFTPWLTLPLDRLAPAPPLRAGLAALRPELIDMAREVFVPRKDPNRIVVEWLRAHAAPGDEILANYEDLPLVYYLPNPIRGGIAAFRVEDDSRTPPRFVVLRRSVPFVHWPVFEREIGRYEWERIALDAPDVVWGNNPDPLGRIQDPDTARPLLIARRRSP